ncbi:pyrimidine dimer DNA glycosylase/endonuclease V [Modicisalibacter luteus]|uniref:Pyrimidine dimer DNA glycosylase/endonuclease V n=1 Tax=Modicisalibacter luteus TaxID=453962 RepID=A0ABV7LWV9_9GAMM|nr:pyrimidine dimer DNA glycosylase/endonuclease V [Halomonas lutea]GHB11175.1 pyrimidine dimer DNA glycosylase /DNA-(apurinic or apyrimidinic site) lyase [Halomonas lutea]
MRLWSLHPCYLDTKGLLALWREGLLAQKVLQGATKGYRHHPQLTRFKRCEDPLGAMAYYLGSVVDEADRRGYRFDRSKIVDSFYTGRLTVTSGQVKYELGHLSGKLQNRDPVAHARLREVGHVRLHPLFDEVAGEIEPWEIV